MLDNVVGVHTTNSQLGKQLYDSLIRTYVYFFYMRTYYYLKNVHINKKTHKSKKKIAIKDKRPCTTCFLDTGFTNHSHEAECIRLVAEDLSTCFECNYWYVNLKEVAVNYS